MAGADLEAVGLVGAVRTGDAVGGVADEGGVVVAGVEEGAGVLVAEEDGVGDGQPGAAGVAGGVEAVGAAGELEVLEGDVGGAGHLDHVRPVARVAAVEESDRAARPLDGNAAILRAEDDVAERVVSPGIDVDDVARLEGVGGEQGLQAGHGRVRSLAAVGIVARGGRVDVTHGRVIIDVVIVPGVGDQERLRRPLRVGPLVGRHPELVVVARVQRARDRPGVAPPAVHVHRQAGGDGRPGCPAVRGHLQVDRGIGHAPGVGRVDLDAREHRRRRRVVDQAQVDPPAAAGGDRVGLGRRFECDPRVGHDVVAGLHRRPLQVDVEDAAAARLVLVGLDEVEADGVDAIRDGQVVRQRVADPVGGLGVALVDGLGRRVGHAGGVHRVAEAEVGRAAGGLELVGAEVVGAGAAGVDQGHRPERGQAGGLPVDGELLAELELVQAAGGEHLHDLGRAGGRLRRVAIGAHVDAAAVGGELLEVVGVGVARGHGRRGRQQVEVEQVLRTRRVDELRVGRDAVAVQPELVEPIHQAGERPPLPQPKAAGTRRVEVVVVALEADLAVGGHHDVVAGLQPRGCCSATARW